MKPEGQGGCRSVIAKAKMTQEDKAEMFGGLKSQSRGL